MQSGKLQHPIQYLHRRHDTFYGRKLRDQRGLQPHQHVASTEECKSECDFGRRHSECPAQRPRHDCDDHRLPNHPGVDDKSGHRHCEDRHHNSQKHDEPEHESRCWAISPNSHYAHTSLWRTINGLRARWYLRGRHCHQRRSNLGTARCRFELHDHDHIYANRGNNRGGAERECTPPSNGIWHGLNCTDNQYYLPSELTRSTLAGRASESLDARPVRLTDTRDGEKEKMIDRNVILKTTSMLLAGVLASGILVLPARAQSPAPAGATAPAGKPSAATAAPFRNQPPRMANRARAYYGMVWGVESLSVKAVESGEIIRFSFHVIDADKAKTLNDKRVDPVLI